MEKYLDIVIMVFLNVNVWICNPELSFWDSPWNVFNSIFTIVLSFYVVLYPIYGFLIINVNKDNLGSEENLKAFGVLYEEQRYHKLHGALFNVKAMIRRFLMVLGIIVF